MPSVFITSKIPEVGINLLRKNGFRVKVNDTGHDLSREQLKEVFGKYESLITLFTDVIDESVLVNASPKLKIIANFAVGFDNIDVLAAKRRGIMVTNTPGVAGESVAEHTFMLILACVKRLIEADKYVRRGQLGRWDPLAFLSPQIWGKTIGIVGMGRIGTHVGHIAYGGFRMRILYFDIVRSEDFEMLTEAKQTSLDHLLRESDIVTLHLPLNPQTKYLIGKEELEMMKNTAILVNTSRGALVSEEALIWALSEKKIAAAGLDVFEHEPQIPGELKTLSNVVLTPHIASATVETREAMAKIAAQNIIDVFEGRTPFGLVRVG